MCKCVYITIQLPKFLFCILHLLTHLTMLTLHNLFMVSKMIEYHRSRTTLLEGFINGNVSITAGSMQMQVCSSFFLRDSLFKACLCVTCSSFDVCFM